MRIALLLVTSMFLVASSAFASGGESCSQTCPSGQVLVSFADGNNATCMCQDIGATMTDTVVTEINCNDPEDDGSCE